MADIIRFPEQSPVEDQQGRKPFRKEGLSYVYEPVDEAGTLLGLRLRADYVERRGGDVHVELIAESLIPGPRTHLHHGKLNLTATTSKAGLAKHLAHLTEGCPWPWAELIEGFSEGILRAERAGAPFQTVGRRPVPEGFEARYLVAPLVLEAAPTILYGPGSSAKGFLAVGCCVAVASEDTSFAGFVTCHGPALYLDWEDSKSYFDIRAWQVSLGFGLEEPPARLIYRQCSGTLKSQATQIAGEIARRHIAFVVIDSVGLACGASGERQSYEDKALELFEALRSFGPVSVLLIDHVSGEGSANGKLAGRSYGSIYKFNLIRNQWEARKEQAFEATTLKVGLFHTKANHSMLHRPVVLQVDFEPEAVRFSQADIASSVALAERLPDHERLERLLQAQGPMLTSEAALALGKQANGVRATVSQYPAKFTRVGQGKSQRITLAVEPDEQEPIPF